MFAVLGYRSCLVPQGANIRLYFLFRSDVYEEFLGVKAGFLMLFVFISAFTTPNKRGQALTLLQRCVRLWQCHFL